MGPRSTDRGNVSMHHWQASLETIFNGAADLASRIGLPKGPFTLSLPSYIVNRYRS